VNRAIAELHAAGVLTSTTLMARANATRGAIDLARSIPSLGIGCHVVLTDGEPTSPKERIPSLLDMSKGAAKTGAFLPSLSGFLLHLFTGRLRAAEIEAETRAQIESLQSAGLHLTHIDTHKHTHMFPNVLRPVLRAARACGIRAIRNPFEPQWAIRASLGAPWLRLAQVSALRWLAPDCRRIIQQEGFATTDGTVAVAGTGILDAPTLRALLQQMPEGTWELVTHPGYNDADLAQVRTRLRASRNAEREALHALREFPHIELVSFAALH
jgi:predicted glycoside hydrolase/deacetylase ChbG (UPF0249 family)